MFFEGDECERLKYDIESLTQTIAEHEAEKEMLQASNSSEKEKIKMMDEEIIVHVESLRVNQKRLRRLRAIRLASRRDQW